MAIHQIIAATVAQRELPGAVGDRDSEFYFGESIDVTRTEGGQAYGTNLTDGYAGWVPQAALSSVVLTPTHRLVAQSAFAYDAPKVRSGFRLRLPLGAFVTATGETAGSYTAIRLQGCAAPLWVPTIALVPMIPHATDTQSDHVTVAEQLLGVPYLWGGRTAHGIDCSGLVQLALSLCGTDCPRDSFQQEAFFTQAVAPHDLRRGDLLFAKRHVAIAVDSETIIHANESLHHAVAVEALEAAKRRYDFHSVKRLI